MGNEAKRIAEGLTDAAYKESERLPNGWRLYLFAVIHPCRFYEISGRMKAFLEAAHIARTYLEQKQWRCYTRHTQLAGLL